MKQILNYLFFGGILFLALACGATESADKKSKLEALKKERAELDDKIKALEAELKPGGETDSAAEKAARVQVATVKELPFIHYIKVQGRIDSDKNVMLSAKAAGTITRVYVNEGQSVHRGQILAQIDSDVLKRNLAELETSLSLAENLFERQKNLWEQNIGTEIQYLQAKNNKESLEKKIASLNEQMQQTKIIAPFNGIVDEVRIKEGEVAAPGVPAIRVVSPSDFKVTAGIAENYITRIEKGYNVIIELPNLDKQVKSKISTVSRVIDPANRTFQIEVSLPDEVSKLVKANMITYINIEDYKNEDAVVIPVNAVQFSNEGSDYVFVAENNRAVSRPVKIGRTFNNDAEILSGLKPGDKIVVAGHRNLVTNQAIAYKQ